jgi:uncharacterized protein (DUF885 family)
MVAPVSPRPARHLLQISALLTLVLMSAVPGFASPAAAAQNSASLALHRLLDSEWEYVLKEFPERATALGDHRYDDRLTDRSAAAVAARRAHHRARLDTVRSIDRSRLEGEDRLSWDILEFTASLDVRGDDLLRSAPGAADMPFSADDSPLSVNPMSGPQFNLPQMVRATRFASEADYRHYLARLEGLPRSLADLQAILDAGRRAGWMPPREALTRLAGQYSPLLTQDLGHHPLYAPFHKFPIDLPTVTQAELSRRGEAALRSAVIPALTAFRDYLANTWIPGGTETLGAVHLPHGEDYYAWSLQRYTTTRMTAREIHDLGLREVSRLDADMRAVMREAGFTGTLAEFRDYLRTDEKFQFSTPDEELAAFRDIAKRVDPQLTSLFVELPRVPYGIRPMSPEEGNNAPHYIAGALDGTRAGFFEANTNNLAAWPRWTMDALFLHEAVPGHHLQIARGQEMPGLPKLRRAYGNSGFSEGWGLYSEGLGKELGLYADPYARFGRLTLEAHRACRLVVDTGMHAFGWTRQQAIDYLIEHAQLERGFAEAEVDRYITWPGQATAYKVGEQNILANRAKARAALGVRFDIRRFHNAVIDHGGLPLTVLDRVIDDWIVTERARPTE